jgi:putative tricarboxylic transport membrane protein
MCVCVFELIFRWFFDMEGTGGLLSQVEQEMDGDGVAEEPEEHHLPQLLIGVGLTIAYVWALPLLGFAVASLIFIALFIWLGTYRRGKVVAAVSVLGTLLLMFIFMKVVYVSLPLGTGPFESISVFLMGLMGIR